MAPRTPPRSAPLPGEERTPPSARQSQSGSGRSSRSRSRPSLTAVFEGMLKEEEREREAQAREAEARKEHWRESRSMLHTSTSSSPLKSPAVRVPESSTPLSSPPVERRGERLSKDAAQSSTAPPAGEPASPGAPARARTPGPPRMSTSPPGSPPPHVRSQHGYPTESSVYPKRPQVRQDARETEASWAVPIPLAEETGSATVEWLAERGKEAAEPGRAGPEPRPNETEVKKARAPANRAVRDEELWRMLSLLKKVLKEQPTLDASRWSETSLDSLANLVAGTNAPQGAREASLTRATMVDARPLADALTQELSMDKLNADDTQYAERLSHIREQLGQLVSSRVWRGARAPRQAQAAPAAASKAEPSAKRRPLRTALPLGAVVLVLAVLLFGALALARRRAEFLMTFTYHDPLNPVLYPLPRYVAAFLPPGVHYNVPFTTLSDVAALAFVEPST